MQVYGEWEWFFMERGRAETATESIVVRFKSFLAEWRSRGFFGRPMTSVSLLGSMAGL